MRAAIYARYSSDQQNPASIEDQLRLCRIRTEHEGWVVSKTYTDAGISGASRFRPGYQQMLADARTGCFDVVISEALDRLSRDQEDTAALFKVLSFANVRFITLAEGDITELHIGLKGTMNAPPCAILPPRPAADCGDVWKRVDRLEGDATAIAWSVS